MAAKNEIWAFILRICIQILNFILSRISGNKEKVVVYKQDEQENKSMRDKVNSVIKDKLNGKLSQ